MNVIIFPVFSLEDVAQGVHVTDVRTAIDFEYGCDVYANALDCFHQKQHYMKISSSLYSVSTQYTLFDAMEFQQR